MTVELLERVEKGNQSENRNNKLSYEDICIQDVQNLDVTTQNAVFAYTKDPDEFNDYERSRPRFSSKNGRGAKSTYENPTPTQEKYEALAEYLNTGNLPSDLSLHRGTSMEYLCDAIEFENIETANFIKDIQSMDDRELNEKYQNQIFTYRQFISTSISPHVAREFLAYPTPCLIQIEAPEGAPGRCIQKLSKSPQEKEVLLNSDTRFRIVKIRTQPDGMKCILVNVVLDETEKTGCDLSA